MSAETTPPDSISEQDRKLIERYRVQLVPVAEIKPSPENNEVYGPTNFDNDPALHMLVRSVARLGLEEPLILTRDSYVLSGHRRLFAVQMLGWDRVPCRIADVTRADATDYRRLLTEYNPQRVKSVATALSEQLLKSSADGDDGRSWAEYHEARSNPDLKLMQVAGCKPAEPVGPRQQEFLAAAQKVITELRAYWPLTVRQVHYQLLNEPPLTQTTKDRNERWRYKNDQAGYKKCSDLLVSARYGLSVPWAAIDDATRESKTYHTYANPAEFIASEVKRFLTGYTRDRMEGQPNHVELIVEKNTLLNILTDIAGQFHIPITALRGYGGPSLWKEIEDRWRMKAENHAGPNPPKCILIFVSDHDPEGLNLPDDAFRSLRDRHGVDVVAVRPATTMEQVRAHKLPSNPAKETSSRYQEYVKRTGTTECWEVEALSPDILRGCVHNAILEAIDVDQLNAVKEREAEEKKDIASIRARLGTQLLEMVSDL